ncbi:MAG: hypothetical protein CVU48_03510 [Candidatus Cloacimonetes bacterium HGW-Cloacimonetes-1]|jgi:hypothetical protein|nr:MAG: hypothetical protein CVU48_03510 [Candidatus Cloacimonetes bacterium HGW-Cloacimonetes-1]
MCKTNKLIPLYLMALSLFIIFTITACGDSSTESEFGANYDGAQSIGASVSYNTGGAVDQMADLSALLVADSKSALQRLNPDKGIVMTYNISTGYWNILLTRERGLAGSHPYANITRNYTLQYRNETGDFQKYYVTNNDTARTVIFNIISGSGEHITRNVHQNLDALTGAWIVTKANTDSVVVNGTYNRQAHDTITGYNSTRVSVNTLAVELENVILPRGYTLHYYNAVSGTLTGTFDATITFSSGDTYVERIVHRDINVSFGEGTAKIDLGARIFKTNLLSGELEN